MGNQVGFNTQEFDKLLRQIENMGTKGKKIAKSSVLEAAEVVLKQQKQDAPKAKQGSTSSYEGLAVDKVKSYRNGSCYAKIGITKNNWEKCKGIYYQHYGFENNGRGGRYKGMYISKHVGWVNKSFKKSQTGAYRLLEMSLKNKIGF